MSEQPNHSDAAQQPGRRAHNWKGGRVLASNGYILVYVGKGHHLADVRGYAYEHRIVAEQKLGRRLRPGELIHHINEDKADNRPQNLQVLPSNAEHFVHHRRDSSNRRLPGDPNDIVLCACGCGEPFRKYDEDGRPRLYVSGHNPQDAPTESAILACLWEGPLHRVDISRRIGKSLQSVAVALSKLKRKGLVVQLARGLWAEKEADCG
jgi:hypothetical protein